MIKNLFSQFLTLRPLLFLFFFTISLLAFGQNADVSITQTAQHNGNDANVSTFVIIVRNNGPNAATNVVVKENLSTDWSFNTPASNHQASHGSLSWAGTNNRNLTWNIPYIPNGGIAVLTLNVYRNFAGYLTPAVSISITGLDQTDSNTGNNTSNSNSTPDYNAHNLGVSMGVNNPLPNVGQNVQFTITLTKLSGGNNLNPVQITSKLPPGLTYVSVASVTSGTYNSSTGVWSIPKNSYNINTETLVVNASVNNPTGATDEYKNVAALTAVGLDTNVTNNIASSSVTVNVGQPADLKLTQSLNNYEPNVGDNVIFTINIENLGPNTASGTRVTDQLPAGFSYVSSSASVGSYNSGTGLWTVGSFANGATATLQITAQRQATGPYANTATVVHNGTDSVSSNNSDSEIPSNVCAGTHTIVSGSGGTITVNSGEIYTLYSGTWSGGVKLNPGGTICIAQGATFTAAYYITPGVDGTIINRGTMTLPLYNTTTNNVNIVNYGTYNTAQFQNYAGDFENYGTFTSSGGADFLTGSSVINEGVFTSTTFQNFAGTLENSGTFTISNNANFLAGATIENHGDMSFTNVTATNASLTNYDSFTANSNFYFLGSSSYLENKSTGHLSLNMTTGNTQIVGQFDNDGTAQIKNANSGSGISAVVNNYGTMQIYDNIIFGITTYLTNDNVLEFHNATSVEFQGPLLQNNDLMTIFNGGNLSLNSSISQMVNNSKVVVGGTVSHNVSGSKIVNNCTIISEDYQLVVGTTENNGLIWVNDEFKLEGASFLINSTTGFIRGTNFRNSGDISGYGSFYFTGNTDFQSAGTFVGNDPTSPIQFFDTTQTSGGIFDTSVVDNPAVNVIRPESMTPYDDTSYDCTAPPTTAGYPPQTEDVEINFCAPAALTFDIDDYAQAHAPVEGNSFTLLYSSIRLFDPNDESNPTNNTTNLVIPNKGSLSVNTTTGVISFTPNIGFTSGSLEAQYRISNQWAGNPPVHPSSRTLITITLNELPDLAVEEGSTPICIGETMTFSNEVADGVWESSDTDVATVVDGVVTAISTGSATISYTVTYPSYPIGTTCTLTVEEEISVQNCACYKNPNTEESDQFSMTGVSTLSGQSRDWPESIPNGFIVLESKNKGFVITRVPEASLITEPKEGMIIYDIADSCVKLYNGIAWNCIQRSCD